jgi:predicted DNA-binding transcriptional regulator AlpA
MTTHSGCWPGVFFYSPVGLAMQTTIEQTSAPPTRLFTPADLSRMFGVDVPTILDWNRNGKLPKSVSPGRSPRWTPQQITAFLENQGAQ